MHHHAGPGGGALLSWGGAAVRVAVVFVGFTVLMQAGWLSSAAALADFLHYFCELAGSFAVAIVQSTRRGVTEGADRIAKQVVEIGMVLGGLVALVQSAIRMIDPEPIASHEPFVVLAAGFAGNLLIALMFRLSALRSRGANSAAKKESLHALVDAAGEAVALVGLVLAATGIAVADPLGGMAIGLLMIGLAVWDHIAAAVRRATRRFT